MKQNPCPNAKMIEIKPLMVCIGEPRTQKTNTIMRSVVHLENVYYFPVERTSSDIFLQLIASETANKLKLSSAVNGYIDMLRTIVRFPKLVMERRTPRDIEIGIRSADMLVKHIVGDNIKLKSIDTGEIEIIAEKTGDIIDISNAASCTKQFFGLVLYLRYIAKEGDTIVVEEPESNLHPMQQAMLSEFFAILVNSGINVVMSTNSPYIVEHLENLIQAFRMEAKAELVNKLLLHDKHVCIDSKKVFCYSFDLSEIKNVINYANGYINWHTFCVIADRMAEIISYVAGYEDEDENEDEINISII